MSVAEIGVRYCGGCNSTYDRFRAVEELKDLLPELSFMIAEPGKRYRAAVIVEGCANACTSTLNLAVPAPGQIRIEGFTDLVPARDRIRELLEQEKT